jgi:hypothetical protein
MEMLRELAKLTLSEFMALMQSGEFTGFTDLELARSDRTNRGKMEAINDALQVAVTAKRQRWIMGQ